MYDTNSPLARYIRPGWFPLIPRPRLPCRSLEDRIGELRTSLTQPHDNVPHNGLVRAAEVCNKAALIASDCGLTEFARALCWRQHAIFDQARPLPVAAARLALQPLLNLPRQMIREGKGQQAHALLEALWQAARDGTSTTIDRRTVNLRNLTGSLEDHKTTCTLVWAALLADGTRALTLAGRWQEAADQAATHRGTGLRLLDGRQAAILALIQQGDADRASAVVEQSTATQPWEHAMQHLLRVLCRRAVGADCEDEITPMLTAVLPLVESPDPSLTVFHTRLGMTALDLAGHHTDPPMLRSALITAAHADARAARDVLDHPTCRAAMTAQQSRDLNQVIHASGLGIGAIPEPLHTELVNLVASAEHQLHALLKLPARSHADGREATWETP